MKNVSKVRLSLRKLLIATLAVGPVAVLPGPVWAAIPTSSSFTVTNGTATVSSTTTIANINASDRAILVWNAGAFNIATGETYNFNLPSNGAVLNKVGYTSTGSLAAQDTATINGSLLSNGRVFILANGNINVGTGSVINTAGGLVLSTLVETSDGPFITTGELSSLSNPASATTTGTINLGTLNVVGNLTAYSGTFSTGNATATSASTSTSTTIDGTSGAVTAVTTPTSGGTGYTAAPSVTLTAPPSGGTQATADAVLTGGVVTGFTITAAGSGYTAAPTATIAANPNLASAGGISGGSVSGDLVLRTVTSGSGLNLARSAALTVGGNLTVVTNNGAITQTSAVSASGNATSLSTGSTGTAGITLANAGNDFSRVALTTNGSASIADTNIITLAASTIGGGLTVAATGTQNSTAISTNGTLTIGGAASFTSTTNNSGINVANNSTVGGALSLSTTTSSATFNGTGNVNVASAATGNGSITIQTSSGNITTSGDIATTGGVTLRTDAGSINQTTGNITPDNTLATAIGGPLGVVTFNATGGNVTLGNVVASRVAVTSNGGSISQAASTSVKTFGINVTNTFNAGTSGNITLDQTGNLLSGTYAFTTTNTANATVTATGTSTSVLQLTGNTVTVRNDATQADYTTVSGNASTAVTGLSSRLTLGTTNTTGNLSLNSPSGVTIGIGTGTLAQSVRVGGTLNVTTNGTTITDNDYSTINVFGALNLDTTAGPTAAGADITLDAASALGSLAPQVTLGQVNITAGTGGTANISESTTLNLGNVTAAALNATSTAGGIVDSGNITATTATFTVPAGQSIVLDGTNNAIGTVNFNGGSDNSFLSNATFSLGTVASTTGNLTIASGSGQNITITSPTIAGNVVVNSGGTIVVGGTGATVVNGNLTLSSNSTSTTAISQTQAIQVTGTTTLGSAGGVALTNVANDFDNVVFSSVAGNAAVADATNLTVSGNVTGILTATAGAGSALGNTWALGLGDLHVGNLVATASNGAGGLSTAGASGAIAQVAGTDIHVTNNARFLTTNGNIVVNNDGNSFGRVELATGNGTINTVGTATVNLSEDGTLRVGNVANQGSTTLTSRFGSIIEDTVSAVGITNNGTLTLNAANGSVTVGGTTNSNTTTGNVTAFVVNAPTGAVALFSSGANVTLGNITGTSLTVNHTGGGNLSQSGRASIFGSSSFTSAGNIVISNTTNNFGRVTLNATAAGKNVTITEAGTLNLGNVAMASATSGNFTATSLSGDIIDTGLAGVKIGGVSTGMGSGVVTLNASSGNIVLDDPTTEFFSNGGVVFNGGNVTLSPLSSIVLGAANTTSVANTLTVTSATGSISNAGNLSVSGDAFFQTGNGNITLTQSGNRFGAVRFTGNQVRITQANDINIITGSTAVGLAEFTSGSYIAIDNRGGIVTLGSTALMSATGSIVLPKLIQIADTLTVTSPSEKNLGALSISGDLGGKSPVNLGTGTYVPPQP